MYIKNSWKNYCTSTIYLTILSGYQHQPKVSHSFGRFMGVTGGLWALGRLVGVRMGVALFWNKLSAQESIESACLIFCSFYRSTRRIRDRFPLPCYTHSDESNILFYSRSIGLTNLDYLDFFNVLKVNWKVKLHDGRWGCFEVGSTIFRQK